MAAGLIRHSSKNVTTAGNRVRLVSESTLVCECVIRGKLANTGNIFIGDDTVDSTGYPIQPAEPFRIADLQYTRLFPKKNDPFIDLYHVWIDAEISGEGVNIIYIDRA